MSRSARIERQAVSTHSSPAWASLWAPFAAAHARYAGLARRPQPAVPRESVLALAPCVLSAFAATLLGSLDWCFGAVRVTLAICLCGAGISGTLLLCWNLPSANVRRSAAIAVLGGLGAAAPLLLS